MNDAVLWNEIGNLYLIVGSPEDAIAAYSKAVEVNPDSGRAYSNLGHAYFLKGEFGHALFMFRKSAQLMDSPENQAIVWNKIGDAYRAMKDIDNAIQAYKKADDLDMKAPRQEKNAEKQSGIIPNVHEKTRNENGLPFGTETPNIQHKKDAAGNTSLEIYQLDEGFQPYPLETALEDNFKQPEPIDTNPAVFPNPTQKPEPDLNPHPGSKPQDTNQLPGPASIIFINKEKPLFVIPEPIENPGKQKNEGVFIHGSKQSENPVKAKPEGTPLEGTPKGQTLAYPGIDNLEEILAKVNIYENITRTNPTNDRGWDTLGKLYKVLGRYKDAIGAYQKAIEMAPDREVYYYYLGLLYSVEQQHDEAIKAFQLVLQKNPDYILAHSALAGIYHRLGLENKANHHIAIALPKMNNESTYNRACFYAICGDKDLAFEFLLLALKNKDTTIDWIKSDPDLDLIRSDPRYQELISEKDQSNLENQKENYFSSGLEGKTNRLLPILNHSLER